MSYIHCRHKIIIFSIPLSITILRIVNTSFALSSLRMSFQKLCTLYSRHWTRDLSFLGAHMVVFFCSRDLYRFGWWRVSVCKRSHRVTCLECPFQREKTPEYSLSLWGFFERITQSQARAPSFYSLNPLSSNTVWIFCWWFET